MEGEWAVAVCFSLYLQESPLVLGTDCSAGFRYFRPTTTDWDAEPSCFLLLRRAAHMGGVWVDFFSLRLGIRLGRLFQPLGYVIPLRRRLRCPRVVAGGAHAGRGASVLPRLPRPPHVDSAQGDSPGGSGGSWGDERRASSGGFPGAKGRPGGCSSLRGAWPESASRRPARVPSSPASRRTRPPSASPSKGAPGIRHPSAGSEAQASHTFP